MQKYWVATIRNWSYLKFWKVRMCLDALAAKVICFKWSLFKHRTFLISLESYLHIKSATGVSHLLVSMHGFVSVERTVNSVAVCLWMLVLVNAISPATHKAFCFPPWLLWVPTRSASLPVCCLASILGPPSTRAPAFLPLRPSRCATVS